MADILIIDDEEIVRRSIRSILEPEGHVIREAATGEEGISTTYKQTPDLIITDIFMPDKDGLEVIQELRQKAPSLKILAITGGGVNHSFNLLPQAKVFGARATLQNPFLREELIAAVDQALNT